MHCNHGWNIAQAPEGYYYYYNTATQGEQSIFRIVFFKKVLDVSNNTYM